MFPGNRIKGLELCNLTHNNKNIEKLINAGYVKNNRGLSEVITTTGLEHYYIFKYILYTNDE